MKSWIPLLLLLAVAAFWFDTMRAREAALRRVGALCRDMGLQLLDETVHFVSIRPCRGRDGWLRLCRRYRFEFSVHAVDRHQGDVVIQGHRVVSIRLEHPDGPVLIGRDSMQ